MAASLQFTEVIANPFQFIGGWGVMAEENGLHYMRNRYYDSSIGRFTSVDPLTVPGVEPYNYARNNPLQFIDPEGLKSEDGIKKKKKKKFGPKMQKYVDKKRKEIDKQSEENKNSSLHQAIKKSNAERVPQRGNGGGGGVRLDSGVGGGGGGGGLGGGKRDNQDNDNKKKDWTFAVATMRTTVM